MMKLTQPETDLLVAATAQADGAIDIPQDAARVVAKLIKRGLVLSMPQTSGPSRLLITLAGRDAISETTGPEGGTAANTRAPGGKLGVLVALLRQPEGASMDALTAATGWQKHSVRGAISGSLKKKLGLAVISEKSEDGRIYRLQVGAGS